LYGAGLDPQQPIIGGSGSSAYADSTKPQLRRVDWLGGGTVLAVMENTKPHLRGFGRIARITKEIVYARLID